MIPASGGGADGVVLAALVLVLSNMQTPVIRIGTLSRPSSTTVAGPVTMRDPVQQVNRVFGRSGDDCFNSVAVTADGNIAVVGYSD